MDKNGNLAYHNNITSGIPDSLENFIRSLSLLSTNVKIYTDKFMLNNNYPNPFNPSTNIDIETVTSGKLLVSIYDISGRLINTLLNKKTDAGYYSVKWNGQNFNGEIMPTGIYFIQVESANQIKRLKSLLIK